MALGCRHLDASIWRDIQDSLASIGHEQMPVTMELGAGWPASGVDKGAHLAIYRASVDYPCIPIYKVQDPLPVKAGPFGGLKAAG